MNARTFGTNDGLTAFADKYGSDDYETVGHAIAAAQRHESRNPLYSGNTHDGPADDCVVCPKPSQVFIDQATDKAIKYLADLWMERSDKATRDQVVAWAKTVDRRVVSDKIDWLKTQPKLKAQTLPDVAAGRYAVTGDNGQTLFLKVDRPAEGPYAGQTFVRLQVSDEYRNVGNAARTTLLNKILAAGPKDAMLRYGRELGSCGHCGRTLTNEESREAGIGPVCRGKMGW
jgi:hypothetical protein